MNVNTTNGHEAENLRRPYHAPELTMLGSIQSVVKGEVGMGADGNDVGGVTHTTPSGA
jgi:hypothetical protein